jgi:DNA-binding LacI/PurR family transcriptional regulator
VFEPTLGIERLGTIKEISALVGVAESTVHRALKGTKVSDETRARVISAVWELNARKIRLVDGDLQRSLHR